MDCKIVYLKPLSGFRTELRSDTLFNALCWAIRQAHGNERLEEVLAAYASGGDEAFYISSCFPYKSIFYCNTADEPKKKKSIKVPYFPAPLRMIKPAPIDQKKKAGERLREYRQRKKSKKTTYLPKHEFEQRLGASNPIQPFGSVYRNAPKVEEHLITHNRISRIKNSTLELDAGGQLFHSPDHKFKIQSLHKTQKTFELLDDNKNEYEVLEQEAGLFFLVKGNFEVLEAPLRLLQHLGIGGDRNIGKGSFKISWEAFHLAEPEKPANAVCNLALYRPEITHIQAIKGYEGPLLCYELVARGGIRGGFMQKKYFKPKVDMIKEGAVLPILSSKSHYGENVTVGKDDREGHDLLQYGYGFMVNMYVPY